MTMINRVLNRLPKGTSALLDDMNQWPDNLDAKKWYYMAIQEATNSHEYESSDTKGEKWTKISRRSQLETLRIAMIGTAAYRQRIHGQVV